ncbi:hypothetical protein PENTCL1PPCAC_9856, partial [Pristionchus entomophagus]
RSAALHIVVLDSPRASRLVRVSCGRRGYRASSLCRQRRRRDDAPVGRIELREQAESDASSETSRRRIGRHHHDNELDHVLLFEDRPGSHTAESYRGMIPICSTEYTFLQADIRYDHLVGSVIRSSDEGSIWSEILHEVPQV